MQCQKRRQCHNFELWFSSVWWLNEYKLPRTEKKDLKIPHRKGEWQKIDEQYELCQNEIHF